jgi:hypothetical protein
MGGSKGGRKDGRRRRRWDERCVMSRRRGAFEGEVGEDEKCRRRVSSIGWKMIRAMSEPGVSGSRESQVPSAP